MSGSHGCSETLSKRCTKCGETKPLGEFGIRKAGKGGRQSQCKACHNAAANQNRLDNPDAYKAIRKRFYQRHAEERRVSSREYGRAHKDERAARKKARRLADPEAARARDRADYIKHRESKLACAARYYAKHKGDPEFMAKAVENSKRYRIKYPEKAKARAKNAKAKYRSRLHDARGSHTTAEWRAILARYDGACVKCGSEQDITLDHVMPLAMGGTDFATNLQPLCLSCNCSKQDKYIDFRPDAYWSDWT